MKNKSGDESEKRNYFGRKYMKRKHGGVSFQRTMYACFVGYVVQAVVNNFIPLLFVMFQDSYQIPLSRITLLITVNFIFQLGVRTKSWTLAHCD